MTLALLPITLLLVVSPVHVEAEICPSGKQIEAALASLLPDVPGSAAPDIAHVYQQGKLLRVELFNPQGGLVGERGLDDSDHCAELAVQVAVVIASLRSEVHREFPHPAQEVPTVPSTPPLPPSAPPPKPRSSYDAALGAGFSYSDSLVLGASLAGLWIPRGVGLGVRLSGGAETGRRLNFSEGRRATWRRWTATSEADWRARLRGVVLDVHAGLAWTVLTAKGEGFQSNGSDSSFSPGVHAGVRLSWWPTTRLAVWLGLDATCWLVDQSVAATVDTPGQSISRFAGMATLGVAIGRTASQPLGSTGLAAQ